MTQKDNICYSDKVLKYTGLNELDIRVDENYMFFRISWGEHYVINNQSPEDCEEMFPKTTATFNLSEISSFIKVLK